MKRIAGGKMTAVLILLLVLTIVGLCAYIFLDKREKRQEPVQAVEANQGEYVKPEQPVDRSINVTLPGWGGFTIPADTKTITEGFEFHNPAENLWYEDQVSIDGQELEKLVVDSGNKTKLEHYLSLAGINETAVEVTGYDEKSFLIEQAEDESYTVEGIAGFEGTKAITVRTDKGNEVRLDVTCETDFYYMTFALYLAENDELLYQSDLVSPGNYIQKMEMTRGLESGTYEAYVVCQPYRSDKTTKTNQGVVEITLTVK